MTWFRLIVDDSDLCSTASFTELLHLALKHQPSAWVRADETEFVGIDGCGVPDTPDVASLDSFIESLAGVIQLVWGRFFFFVSREEAESAVKKTIEASIAGSRFTICAVDNTAFFVYTQSPALASAITGNRKGVEVVQGSLPYVLSLPEEF